MTMKVLQLGKFYPIRGGVEKVMWSLTCGLSAAGISCDMLCATLDMDDVDATDRRLLQDDGTMALGPYGRVIRVEAKGMAAATMLAPAMASWMRDHAAEYNVIHIHHPDPMAALALWRSGYDGRVVLHWHSDIVTRRALLTLYAPLQRWLLRRADAIVATSPAYASASRWLRKYQGKTVVIPIGIRPVVPDMEGAARLRQEHPCGTLLLALGRLVPYKGFEYLVEAMRYLPEDYHLLLCGDGPLRQDLEIQVSVLGLGGRVSLEGRIAEEAKAAYFGACDIFVLPSVMRTEAFGIVQAEAMSCGRPVVATAIPGSGVSWVNADGVSGRNAAPREGRALAAAIRDVAARYGEYAGGALTRYNTLFTEDRMLKSTIDLYETLV